MIEGPSRRSGASGRLHESGVDTKFAARFIEIGIQTDFAALAKMG
jgi:hypothetical protein